MADHIVGASQRSFFMMILHTGRARWQISKAARRASSTVRAPYASLRWVPSRQGLFRRRGQIAPDKDATAFLGAEFLHQRIHVGVRPGGQLEKAQQAVHLG